MTVSASPRTATRATAVVQPGIVVILEQFRVGGLERVVLAQVRGLLDLGFDVTVAVLVPDRDNPLVAELDGRADLVALPTGRMRRARVLHALARGRTVMIHLGCGRLYPSLRPGLTGSRSVVRFCHSDYTHLRGRWKNLLDRWIAHGDDVIVAVGGRSTQFMVEDVGVPATKVVTLPNSIPPATGDGRPSASALPVVPAQADTSGLRLIAVADFTPHKGQDVVLRALARVATAAADTELVLIGDGPQTLHLWRLAHQLGVLSRVTWLGATWHGELVRQFLRASHVFVSMSRAEGIPISVLEARQEGLPMVLSDIPGHRDGGGELARYVPVDDDAALADAIVEAWRTGSLGRRSGDRGRTAVEYWESYLAQLVTILRG